MVPRVLDQSPVYIWFLCPTFEFDGLENHIIFHSNCYAETLFTCADTPKYDINVSDSYSVAVKYHTELQISPQNPMRYRWIPLNHIFHPLKSPLNSRKKHH